VNKHPVLIVGAGIGGLTAALCLAKKGFNVALYEQAHSLEETGAGIQLSPNATHVLHYLGLETQLRSHAFLPTATQFRHWRSGRIISQSELGQAVVNKYGMPYYHIHRGDLLQVLVDAVAIEPRISLTLNTRALSFDQDDREVRVTCNSGTYQGAALVGADGIHSKVREGLWGPQNPKFTGNIAWRALVPANKLPDGLIRPMSSVWWGPGRHFVHYYVRSGQLVNCVCVVEKSGWQLESWTEPGALSELRSDFAGWHDDITQLIDNMDEHSLYKWALFDRDPMPAWGQGRVSLLGDACHPTLPYMAQGAAMAIEDAAVLAGCMERYTNIATALTEYEGLRRQRTAGIQAGSRRNARVFHMSGIQAWLRNRAASTAGRRTLDQLFRYNAIEVADDPRLTTTDL